MVKFIYKKFSIKLKRDVLKVLLLLMQFYLPEVLFRYFKFIFIDKYWI